MDLYMNAPMITKVEATLLGGSDNGRVMTLAYLERSIPSYRSARLLASYDPDWPVVGHAPHLDEYMLIQDSVERWRDKFTANYRFVARACGSGCGWCDYPCTARQHSQNWYVDHTICLFCGSEHPAKPLVWSADE